LLKESQPTQNNTLTRVCMHVNLPAQNNVYFRFLSRTSWEPALFDIGAYAPIS